MLRCHDSGSSSLGRTQRVREGGQGCAVLPRNSLLIMQTKLMRVIED